jgi:hypothetical protein
MTTSPLRPLDTSQSAWEKVTEIHARLGPEGRVAASFAASELIREVALAGLRQHHPAWTERQVSMALIHRLYGADLAALALCVAGGEG